MKSLLVLPAALLLLFAVSCSDNGKGGKVSITLQEWSVTEDKTSLEEGPIEFTINDKGQRSHEFQVVRTDIAADALPAKADGSFDSSAPGVDVKQKVDAIDSGGKTGRTYTLSPGKYVFICNRVETINGTKTSHFGQGMRVAFEVTAKK